MQNRRRKPQVYAHPNSQYWWLRYYNERDELVRESARTTDRVNAQRLLESRLKQVENRKQAESGSLNAQFRVTLDASMRAGDPKVCNRREMSLVRRVDLANAEAVEDFARAATKFVDDFIRNTASASDLAS